MKALVTGAAGFLARALLQRLARQKNLEVHGVDQRPVVHGIAHPCQLTSQSQVTDLLQAIKPDRLYHLAGSFTNEFEADFQNNVVASRNLLEAARSLGGGVRILLIGSAAEYGWVSPEDNPVGEDRPLAPVSLYGWSKACQTQLMGYYHRVHQTPVLMARLFNLIGPEAPRRLFVGRVQEQIQQFKRGEIDCIRTGNLSSQRDYLPVDQAAEQLTCILERGLPGQVYHVGSGEPTSTRELLGRLLAEQGLTMDVVRDGAQAAPDKLDVPIIFAKTAKTQALMRQADPKVGRDSVLRPGLGQVEP